MKDVSSIIICEVDGAKTEHAQLKRITSIKIKNMSSGDFSQEEVIGQSLTVYRKGRIKQCLFKAWSIKPIETIQYKIDQSVADGFFDGLVNNIRVNEWKSDYGVSVCDGWRWECKIIYLDKSNKKIVGTVEPPPRGVELIKQIKNLTDYKVKPWLF